MNIYITTTQFAVLILLYWVISEVFTVLFQLIGLPQEKARFQVISLLTGCGFTTRESEMILSNRPRRRLARITMLFGYVFNLTIVSSLINMFFSIQVTQLKAKLFSMLIPAAALIGVVLLSRIRRVRAWVDRRIKTYAGQFGRQNAYNSIVQIDQIGKQTIAQVTLKSVPADLQGKTLVETGLKSEHNILVMLIEHDTEPPQAAGADTVFDRGDRLTLFGDYQSICRIFHAKELFSDAPDPE